LDCAQWLTIQPTASNLVHLEDDMISFPALLKPLG